MKNGMFIGIALGMVTGAFIVSKNSKARKMIDDASEQIMTKISSMNKQNESSMPMESNQSY